MHVIKHRKPTCNLVVHLNCDVRGGVGTRFRFTFQWRGHYRTYIIQVDVFIAARARKQLTMSYHVRVTLLCIQCLYAGIRSSTLFLPYILLVLLDMTCSVNVLINNYRSIIVLLQVM